MAELKIHGPYSVDVSADGETFALPTPVGSMASARVINHNNRSAGAGPDGSSADQEANVLGVAPVLTAVGTVTFRRPTPTPGATTRCEFSVVEYIGAPGGAHEFIVRARLEIDLTSTNSATTPADTVTGVVNVDDCIPRINGLHTTDTTNGAAGIAALAFMPSATQVTVEVGANNAETKKAFVEVSEFTGSAWTALHGRSDGGTTDSGTINLAVGADGSGAVGDVGDWANAVIDSWGHSNDGTNEAIADLWPLFKPAANTLTVDYEFDAQHDGTDDDVFVHVLVNDEMAVTRYAPVEIAAAVTEPIDITSAGLTELDESLIYGTMKTSGNLTSRYGRGWRNYTLTSLTAAQHYCHRLGGDITHNIEVVDFTGLTDGPAPQPPGGQSFETKIWDPAMSMLVPASIKVGDGSALADARWGPEPTPPANGYNPANYVPPGVLTTFPDPYEDQLGYVFFSETVPEVRVVADLFKNSTRPTALTTSNQTAGTAFTDPLVRPGQPQPSNHEHEFLGNVLSVDADLFDLPNEPLLWQPGSHAFIEQKGFPALITDGNDDRFGYSPGIWWPRIHFNGVPVVHKRGIATYYVRQVLHNGFRVFLLPNAAGYVTFEVNLNETAGDFRMSVRGPNWFHEDIHLGPFPEVDTGYNNPYIDFGPTWPGTGWYAAAQFQTYLKFPKPPGINSLADLNGGHLDPRFTYGSGDPQSTIPFHLDYVSGWTNYNFAQELLDRACNRDINVKNNNIKFEAFRPSWVG